MAAAAAEESAEAAAAATMMEMMVGGGVTIVGSRARKIKPSSPPWTSWRQAVHLWIATLLGLRLRLLVLVSRSKDDRAISTLSADRSFTKEATSVSSRRGLRGGVEPRRMLLRYFTSTVELWAVRC